jgi:hypothetical protein
LRYFAHRSLHRFQAEHWDFEDWKKEIDWILKKRLNLFMLRIGMDDLFQKAFPELVTYPSPEKPLPEAIPRSYDDRTLFWSLEYRAELRKKILDYAFERDLMHPEDFGAMTHWYSRTPKDFLEKVKPDFLPQTTKAYNQETGLVWDIRKEKNLDNYLKLTEAHIKEYGKPEIFHTIGLAERRSFESRKENLQLKLFTYRTLINKLRERYPNAPVMIASWDFPMYWEDEEVQKLVSEFNPDNTIILDYTADAKNENHNFTKWNVVKRFPWIFGFFHAYESNADIRGDYEHISKRLKIAANDDFCKGMVFWPETSHTDIFMLEFFTSNSWSPLSCSINEQIKKFCDDRYGSLNKEMTSVWKAFMPIGQLFSFHWDRSKQYKDTNGIYYRLLHRTPIDKEKLQTWRYFHKRFAPELEKAPKFLSKLASVNFSENNEFLCRDIMDIGKAVIERFLFFGVISLELEMEKWRKSKSSPEKIMRLGEACYDMMENLGEFIGLHHDHSLYKSLEKLGEKHKLNPIFENTLKGNAENFYCRTSIYELFKDVYLKEMRVYLKWMFDKIESGDKNELEKPEYFEIEQEKIRDEFYKKPLTEMAPKKVKNKKKAIAEKLLEMSKIAQKIMRKI